MPDSMQKVRDFLQQMRARLNPPAPTPEPGYTSTFRLSREEIQLLDIIVTLEIKAALSMGLTLEWSEALRLGKQYPFRQDDPSLVTSIKIGEMFTYDKDWENRR